MPLTQLMTSLRQKSADPGSMNTIHASTGGGISVYASSVRMQGGNLFFIGRQESGKYLYITSAEGNGGQSSGFEGVQVPGVILAENLRTLRCPFSHANAALLREIFQFTRPVLIGLADSFGFGDRLGIANPAHIRSLAGSHMRPVLAQQSIRELDRTQRSAEEVLDAASWAVFQEGYTQGFGADADHLKTPDDIDRYARAGFTMFTFDPSANVENEAVTLPAEMLRLRAQHIETGDLRLEDALARYARQTFKLEDGSVLQPSKDEITRAFVKYGKAVSYTGVLFRHLKQRHPSLPSEVELSVDETDIPSTPTEHLFVAGELKRMGVEWISLAPRFVGDFEKGVDYRGDLSLFKREYLQHLSIAKLMGPYKISIHSGSDKFSVYNVIGSIRQGAVHVKTAGTSYLEALRTAAHAEPPLMRSVLDYAREQYEEQRKSYHVTARLDRVPKGNECSDERLLALFEEHDARQVFHVTFGKVLTDRGADGKYLFREKLMRCLDQNEGLHYETLVRHFRKHLDPFSRA